MKKECSSLWAKKRPAKAGLYLWRTLGDYQAFPAPDPSGRAKARSVALLTRQSNLADFHCTEGVENTG